LVSQQLSEKSGVEYTSVAIYRRPQFFVYPPYLPMFNQQEGVKLPKFVVRLNSERVLFGFYIEKSDDKMGTDWYWLRFLELLSKTEWQDYLERIMVEMELRWELWFEEKIEETGSYKLSAGPIVSSFGEEDRFMNFFDFATYLREGLPDGSWCNLYLAKSLAKQEAIDRKEKISLPISDTFNELNAFFSQLLSTL
jgi:hypothetical protein